MIVCKHRVAMSLSICDDESQHGSSQLPASRSSSFEVTHVTTLGGPLHRPDQPLMARFNT